MFISVYVCMYLYVFCTFTHLKDAPMFRCFYAETIKAWIDLTYIWRDFKGLEW